MTRVREPNPVPRVPRLAPPPTPPVARGSTPATADTTRSGACCRRRSRRSRRLCGGRRARGGRARWRSRCGRGGTARVGLLHWVREHLPIELVLLIEYDLRLFRSRRRLGVVNDLLVAPSGLLAHRWRVGSAPARLAAASPNARRDVARSRLPRATTYRS